MKVLKIVFIFSLLTLSMAVRAEHISGELIVKFKSTLEGDEENLFKVVSDHLGFETLGEELQKEKDVLILQSYKWANVYHIKVHPKDNFKEVMEEIQKMEKVEYVEPNYVFKLSTMIQVIDEKVTETSSSTQKEWMSKEISQGGEKMTIAVVDTGLDYTHADIAPYLWLNEKEMAGDGIDNDNNGYVDDTAGWDFVNNDNDPYDDHYHGTHVSGIILSLQDKLNPVMKIMPLKFLDKNGFGSTGNAIKAIDYAIKNGAKILNNSWGGGSFSFALRDAIVASYRANRVFVVAAGNSGEDLDQKPSYPPSYLVPNMISVAALNQNDHLAWFSNFGPKTVHVGAKGVAIYSTFPKERCDIPPCYGYLTGTSMAAPYVSGVAALMLSKNPELMHLQVKKVIMETSVSNASLEGYIGKGSVEPDDAILTASNTEPDGNIPPYSPTSIPSNIGLTSSKAATAMGCGMISDLDSRFRGNDKDSDSFTSGSASILFLWSFPLLFVLLLRSGVIPSVARNLRRKLLFYQF